MKLIINEKQLKLILSKEIELGEQDAETVSSEPTAGTSSTQSGGQGYPSVGKWESGVTRGAGNQIGITKWSDVVGSTIKRGKGNPLKEQIIGTYKPDQPQVPVLDKHKSLEILALVSGLLSGGLGYALPLILGTADAKLYWDEGDKKTAYLVGIFSFLPGITHLVGKIPGIKELGVKGLSNLAVKFSKGSKITNPIEIKVLEGIAKNRQLILQEIKNASKEMSIRAAKNAIKTRSNIGKGALNLGKDASIYGGTYLGYNKLYDYNQRKEEEKNLEKLDLRLKELSKNKK